MLRRAWPYAVIAVIALLFFHSLLLHPDATIYSDYSDLLAEHLPAKVFWVRSWHETGEFPRWCPYQLGGLPFLHDPQVAAFYPPHWLLLLLPEDRVGTGLSWLVVAHVILAGWGMFAYARRRELGTTGSLTAALGCMLAGKWLLHLLLGGQYVLVGLAWLPWVLLALESALCSFAAQQSCTGTAWATLAGCLFALLLLGTQPQWALYAGLFMALWTVKPCATGGLPACVCSSSDTGRQAASGTEDKANTGRQAASGTRVRRWLLCLAWMALLAGLLAAVQLWPTAEAAGLSTRSGQAPEAPSLGPSLALLLRLLGPAPVTHPTQFPWETHGGLGLLWLAAAAAAPWLAAPRARWPGIVLAVMLLLTFTGSLFFPLLPGLKMFRFHQRLLVIVVFPIAFLAGQSVDVLARKLPLEAVQRGRLFLALVVAAFLAGISCRLFFQDAAGQPNTAGLVYWLWLIPALALAVGLCGSDTEAMRQARALAWPGLLLVDLVLLAWSLPQARDASEIYPTSATLGYLARQDGQPFRVLDIDGPDAQGRPEMFNGSPLGMGAPLATLRRIEAVRGCNPLDVARYKEFLQFLSDRDDPLHGGAGPHSLTFPVIPNFPLVSRPLLDLLGVRYLLQRSDQEAPVDWASAAEDPAPRAFNFGYGGVQTLLPYTVWENPQVLPRAFLVGQGLPLGQRDKVLDELKRVNFRVAAYLEGWDPNSEPLPQDRGFRPVTVREYRPNTIVLGLPEPSEGVLVLADVWYPGWSCTIDGKPAEIHRADFAFRGVLIPAGAHEVVFHFDPPSLRRGRMVSLIAFGVAALIVAGGLLLRPRLESRL
jgi:hypothetical protein